MLQSMVALHEKVCKGQIMTPKPLPIINKEVQRQQQQARKRKPDKSSICHLIPQVILREEPEPEITITPTTVLSRLSSPPDEKQPCTSIRSKISTESLESMSGVMRVRPNFQRKFDNNGSVDELQASHVSFFYYVQISNALKSKDLFLGQYLQVQVPQGSQTKLGRKENAFR